MKKTFVAVSAISLLSLTGTAMAESNMASWVAKNKPQPVPVQEIQKTESTQPIQSIQHIENTTKPEPVIESPVNSVSQQPQHPIVVQPTTPQPNKIGIMRPHTQQQVPNESAQQEARARALQSLMPSAVEAINLPSNSLEQKKYAFQYLGHISQLISDPKNYKVDSVVPGFNKTISCATAVGATNTLMKAHNTLMQNSVLRENFQIARSRGNLLNFGQQISGVSCK